MREIKFRAWDSENNEMVYNIHLNYHEIEGTLKPVMPGYQWFNEENTIYHSKPMQYTGLKDKNSKEIYEGDFIKAEWGIGNADYRIVGEDGLPEFYHWFIEYCFEEDNLEVIGNKYVNSELIENEG